MLRQPLTEPREIVSLLDPAMKQIDRQRRIAYSLSRNMDDLGDISTLKNQFTVAIIHPMRPETRHLAGLLHLLFAANCSDVKNGPTGPSDFETTEGMISLKTESLPKLPFDSALEWGQVVLDLASVNGVDSPFSSRATEWESRILEAERQDAVRAAMDMSANPPHSKPSASENLQPDSEPEPNGPSTPNP
jgi:hypothetical protein